MAKRGTEDRQGENMVGPTKMKTLKLCTDDPRHQMPTVIYPDQTRCRVQQANALPRLDATPIPDILCR